MNIQMVYSRNYRLYFRQIKLSILNLWVYRWDFFGDLVRFPITISMHLLIFFYLFKSGSIINGFSQSEGMTYILVVSMISRSLSQRGLALIMEQKIVKGDLTMDLTIPINISFYLFTKRMGYPIYLMIISIINYWLLMMIFPQMFIVPELSRIIGTIVFAFFAMIIQMQIYYIIGILAFWLKNIGFLTALFSQIQSILGGRYLPVTWLPQIIIILAQFLPFVQIYYIPAVILLNKESIAISFLFIQLFTWIIVLQLLLSIVEKKGLKKFDGEGG